MKKLLAILLALTMVFALCACTEKTAEPEMIPDTPVEETLPEEPAEEPEQEEAPSPEEVEEEPEEEVTEEPEVQEEPAEEESELPLLSGTVGEAGYWYDVINEQGEYTDLSGNAIQYSYAIPAFNVDSADASRLNDAIMEICQPYVDEILEGVENGYSLMTRGVSYDASLVGEIVSLLITVETDFGFTDYYTFNLNVATGNEATGADMIAQVGLEESAFVTAAQEAASACFKSKYGSMEGDAFYQELYDKTMSADIYSLYMPIFFDADGSLNVIAPIYAMAGAEYYYEILPIG